ncbi:hypothetical protein MUU77_09550 [Pseudoxanthomonas sp. F37]|jgi:hypothetical protein|uniref:hypothetical protein n=1 Tax=Pseudoxanthomonas sp. F37 TaxID=2932492 RepID=UPI001FD428B6|nr:hypothetical protein [Pseudoxanthomonas sp. F37]UOV07124.1 hypothetical protein MUU77_09550 [Pseudoxanthomonas sp. F37]
MDARAHPGLRLALLLAVLLVPSGARGQGGELGAEWRPVDPARLAQMRGGFQMPSGMMLSFGIERVVFLNGELTARIAVRIPDVARITPEQAQALADFNRGMVVQIGEGNRFDPAQGAGGLVIQNTLDDQDIRTLTRIEVGTDTLGAYQNLNANGALTDALIRTPGGP